MLFTQKYIDKLFIAETSGDDRGFIAFVTPNPISPSGDSVSLQDALENQNYNGNFVFSATTLSIQNETEAQTFVNNINQLIASGSANRGMIWLRQSNINLINRANSAIMGLTSDGSAINTGLQAPLVSGLNLVIQNGMQLILNENTITINGVPNNLQITFSGTSAPDNIPAKLGYLDFTGSLRGCIRFSNFISRLSLLNKMQWGFQYLFPETNGSGEDALAEWLPLAKSTPAGDYLGFDVSIDPTDATNEVFDPCPTLETETCTISAAYQSRRTYFDFTGKNSDDHQTVLQSYFTSNFGNGVTLIPKQESTNVYNARLVFSIGEINSQSNLAVFHLTPEGDFEVQFVEEIKSKEYYLMCGLQGTEFFKLSQKGDSIRFISKNPAYAPQFPFEAASPVKAPETPDAPLLTNGKETAWATILNTSGNKITYVSQPKGSALFGENGASDLFVHNTLGFTYVANDQTLFPMAPYLGLNVGNGITSFSASDSETFESQIISQTRRKYIGEASTSISLASSNISLNGSETASTTTTTPSGLLATVSQSTKETKWSEIFLGQNSDQGKEYQMSFTKPDNELVEAFQTSDLFLVVANAEHLGAFDPKGDIETTFNNLMSIDGWKLQANIGEGSEYNNYKNIMIVKGRKGKLFDPDSDPNISAQNSLVANPKKWTQRNVFGAPSTIDSEGNQQDPDSSQLVILSQWMQTYFQQAHEQGDNAYFEKFNTIATDENWTGILILRMDINQTPSNLQGIKAGIVDEGAFNAHHFAIEISPVVKGSNGAAINQSSTMFGLIYYVDPDFDDTKSPPETIAPTTATTYDFRLLSLKVLFENTAVKNFESFSQLTINELFDTQVLAMQNQQNVFKNILLQGSFQINNGNAVYSMGSVDDNTFLFTSNIYNKIEITNVLLTTRETPKAGFSESFFSMQGFIDYKIIPDANGGNFDIFSFGSATDTLTPRTGLNFNNLGISMIYENSNPLPTKVLAFDANEITFDVTTSTARNNSLYLNFALDLKGLLMGTTDKSPQDQGFLAVIPDARLSGVQGSIWYGLDYKLNMGTPGELAGKASLNSYLLLSWTPDSAGDTYNANIGISLPGTGGGAKLISLQNVLKLSIGQIRLAFDSTQSSFLLMFTEIALKFLGLLKIPPNGSTLFYLFGNPNSGGKSSGLGWYAMYNNEPKEAKKVEATQKDLLLSE